MVEEERLDFEMVREKFKLCVNKVKDENEEIELVDVF